MSETDIVTDAEDQPEELTNWQTNDRVVRQKVASMYRFSNEVDMRRMPQSTFETAMADRATLARHADNRKTTNRAKRMFQTNSVVSIHRDDKLLRVVLTESLPFMCAICGEAFAHTKPLEDHAEEKHGYFQKFVDVKQPRKNPIIIDKNFGKIEDMRFPPMEDIEHESDTPADHVTDQDDDTMDDDPPEVPSKWEGDDVPQEVLKPEVLSGATEASNPEEGVELILTQMANQAIVPIRKRAREDDKDASNTNDTLAPAKSTSGNIHVVVKKQKRKEKKDKKKKKKKRNKYTIHNADHIVPKQTQNDEQTKEKTVPLDENGEPRETRTLKPFCVICHLHCKTRVAYREHLAEAHYIFPSREDAVKAREKMKESNNVNGWIAETDQVVDAPKAQRVGEEQGDQVADAPTDQVSDEEQRDEVADAQKDQGLGEEQRDHVADAPKDQGFGEEQRDQVADPPKDQGLGKEQEDQVADAPKDPVSGEEQRDQVTDTEKDQRAGEKQDQSKSSDAEIIKCDFCESYVFDESTLEKHMRAHCGNPGIKCDICREGIRLWENSRMEELKDLAQRMLSVDRRPQDVDCDPGKSVPRRFPNSKVVSNCYECDDQFYHSSHMGNHYAKAHVSITCRECGSILPNMATLAIHSLERHRPGVFRCQWCPRRFHDRGKFNYHLAGHMGQYRCHGCGRNFVEKPSLMYHIKKYKKYPEHFQGRQTTAQEISVDKPYLTDGVTDHQNRALTVMVCDLCNAPFVNKGNYTRHMNKVHPGHEGQRLDNTYICDTCGNVFWSKNNLMAHMKIHNKKFPCSYPGCPKKFWAVGMMRRHAQTHDAHPTYFCQDCGKTFQNAGSLRFHKRTHTSRVSKCEVCLEEFKGRSNLANHLLEAHGRELHFTCGICQKHFASRKRLLSHAKVHSEHLNDFVCEKCTCTFPEERLLLRHMRVHEKVYKCNFCHKEFSSTDGIKSHHVKEHSLPAQVVPATIQEYNEGIQIQVQDGEGVVIVEYPADDQEATDRAIAAIVSELQG